MFNYTWRCKRISGENLCACYRKDSSVSTERKRLSNAEEVQISLLLRISDCVWANNTAGLFRGRILASEVSFVYMQLLANFQADIKALQEELHARYSLQAIYSIVDVLVCQRTRKERRSQCTDPKCCRTPGEELQTDKLSVAIIGTAAKTSHSLTKAFVTAILLWLSTFIHSLKLFLPSIKRCRC